MNCPIESLILGKDPEIYSFISNLDETISLIDDLVDHNINPDLSVRIAYNISNCFRIINGRRGLYERISETLNILVKALLDDIDFVPMRSSNENELHLWIKRGYRLKLAFDCLCYVDPEFDTQQNNSWILQTQLQGLIRNDCSDIINGEFEDFYQLRRNYVALTCFNQDIYFNWKSRREELVEKAYNIMTNIKFSQPEDDRLKPVYEQLGV